MEMQYIDDVGNTIQQKGRNARHAWEVGVLIPWIQVYTNLPRHPKVTRLADELGLRSGAVNPNAVAVGLLVSLWTWAAQNASDGDLSACGARAVADACTWKKDPQALLDGLMRAGFIEPDMRLHNWDKYEYLFVDALARKRETDRRRAQQYRERKRAEKRDASRDAHVTGSENHATTVPYRTDTGNDLQNQYPNDCLLPEERKQKERSALAESFFAGCEGKLIRAKAIIAVSEAREARARGDEYRAMLWCDVAEMGGITVDREALTYE